MIYYNNYLVYRFFNISMEILPKILSSSEIYGNLSDGPLKGIPISGVSNIFVNISLPNIYGKPLKNKSTHLKQCLPFNEKVIKFN